MTLTVMHPLNDRRCAGAVDAAILTAEEALS